MDDTRPSHLAVEPPKHPSHPDFLDQAVRAALRGPRFDPNPRVGCVLVSGDGAVLATGFHRGAGTPHAEADALAAARASGQDTRGATAYVTLEPCNHHGRTPACAEALLAAGVARVIFAEADPTELAAGGADTLRAAGVTVKHVKHALSRELLAPWLLRDRPWVTLKLATSLDGRLAAADGTSQWLTGAAAREDCHSRRAEHDAIAVGTGTLLTDDPSLTARDVHGELLPRQPRPVIFGRRPIPARARVRQHPRPALQYEGRDLAADLRHLREQGVRGLFVEGGPRLATVFLAAGLVDELLLYTAPVLLGGPHSWVGDARVPTLASAPAFDFDEVTPLGADLLLRARPRPTPGENRRATTTSHH